MATVRAFDAAVNRADEGFRVVEDFTRFILDDRYLASLANVLRRDLTAATPVIPAYGRLAARETEADVGAEHTSAEIFRTGASGVCTANLKRIDQALRSVEEYGKLIDAEMVGRIEQLRHRTNTLERCIGVHESSRNRLMNARFYVLMDGHGTREDFKSYAQSLVDAGVDLIQLRDKRLTDRELVDRARWLVEVTRSTDTLTIINDRPDIAAAVRADGVHVGQEEMSVQDARIVVGPDSLIGVSTHSIAQAEAAIIEGASYLGVGPVFASKTKRFDSLPGLAFVRDVAKMTRLPWFAIGGIEGSNLKTVLSAGARRVAVQGAVWNESNPENAARGLRNQLPIGDG